jgi:nitric oxide dioxygenase
VPALEAHGLDITRRMYERMFQNAAIRDLFNQSHHGETGSQPKALAAAIVAYAHNIDNLGALASRVERIAQKHVGLNVLPEHYPAVAEALLGAIKDVLGDAATEDIVTAWGEAYWLLADVLIAREASIYRGLAAAPGEWTGWRDFLVESTEPESEIIRSFLLVPADGGPVLRHRPGQYLTFALEVPGPATTFTELANEGGTLPPGRVMSFTMSPVSSTTWAASSGRMLMRSTRPRRISAASARASGCPNAACRFSTVAR